MRAVTLAAIGASLGMIAAALYKAPDIRQALTTYGPEFDNLHPATQAAALQVLERANAAGLRVGIFEGWRDTATQRKRIEAGASGVTDPLNSYHPWGLAVDFVFLDALGRWTWLPDPKNQNNTAYRHPDWYRLGEIIEAAGFEWGGRWNNFDGPHAQLPVRRVADLRASYQNPLDYIGSVANV